MSTNQRIQVEIKQAVAHVSLARPDKRNALDMAMFKAIRQTINQLRKNRDIRAVILTGQGEDFCSGLDVKSVMTQAGGPIKLLLKWLPWRSNLAQYVSTGWRRIGAPVIAVIHGRCWGGGLHIALGADFRIATPNASLSIMESRWGLIPDMGGLLALRENCRLDQAKEITMTAKLFNGQEAQSMGLITHVSDEPLAMAEHLAQEICEQSPDSVAAVKKLYQNSWTGGSGMALFRETAYQLRVLFGKNRAIKTHNQLKPDQAKPFATRKRW